MNKIGSNQIIKLTDIIELLQKQYQVDLTIEDVFNYGSNASVNWLFRPTTEKIFINTPDYTICKAVVDCSLRAKGETNKKYKKLVAFDYFQFIGLADYQICEFLAGSGKSVNCAYNLYFVKGSHLCSLTSQDVVGKYIAGHHFHSTDMFNSFSVEFKPTFSFVDINMEEKNGALADHYLYRSKGAKWSKNFPFLNLNVDLEDIFLGIDDLISLIKLITGELFLNVAAMHHYFIVVPDIPDNFDVFENASEQSLADSLIKWGEHMTDETKISEIFPKELLVAIKSFSQAYSVYQGKGKIDKTFRQILGDVLLQYQQQGILTQAGSDRILTLANLDPKGTKHKKIAPGI